MQAITKIVKDEGFSEPWYLRVRLLPGGCTGFIHKLDLDSQFSPTEDLLLESNGVKVVVTKRHVEMLRGAQVDHIQDGDKLGFHFKNPNFEGELLKKWLPILAAEAPPHPKLTAIQLGEKIAQFRTMTKGDPENELAHFRLAQYLMDDEQFGEAVKSFEKTIELAPDFAKAHQLLASCLVKIDRRERAIEVLKRAWKIADKRDDQQSRKDVATLLSELGEAVPLESPKRK